MINLAQHQQMITYPILDKMWCMYITSRLAKIDNVRICGLHTDIAPCLNIVYMRTPLGRSDREGVWSLGYVGTREILLGTKTGYLKKNMSRCHSGV